MTFAFKQAIYQYAKAPLDAAYSLLLVMGWHTYRLMPHSHKRKQVLLFANNELMAKYVELSYRLIKDHPDIDFYFTSPVMDMTQKKGRSIAKRIGIPYVRPTLARMKKWDCILFADFRGARRFHPSIPKIMVNHSITCGKVVSGHDYRFGPNAIQNGKPLFTQIFESSTETQKRAYALNPTLKNHITVVGDLRSDCLLSLQAHRADIRQKMGYDNENIVVFIASTWRSTSLIESVGEKIIPQATYLSQNSRYRFIFSTHPHHWHGTYSQKKPWGKRLLELEQAGHRIMRPDEDWEKYFTVSDIGIFDHTSLCVTYAQLARPILFVPIATECLIEGSIVQELYQHSYRIKNIDALKDELDTARSQFNPSTLNSLQHKINSYPLQSAQRMKSVFYQTLDIEPPQNDI